MIKKILRVSNFMMIVFFVVSFILFSNLSYVKAAQMGSDTNEDNSMNIVIEETNNALDGLKTKLVPDLGDDQLFPFIPGFGKNSGKD
tara:strand:- start:259 stop:519 length:261 start_codon:yes stop_codon:yes gene_type:complete